MDTFLMYFQQITPGELLETLPDIFQAFDSRAQYLNCAKHTMIATTPVVIAPISRPSQGPNAKVSMLCLPFVHLTRHILMNNDLQDYVNCKKKLHIVNAMQMFSQYQDIRLTS